MVKRVQVQGLTEGAILATVVALLAISARYFPPLALVAPLVCPLPLTVLVIRHGVRIAFLAGFVSVAVGVILAGPLTGLLIASLSIPLGIGMGVAVRRRLSAPMIILVTGLAAILMILANVAGSLVVAGVNPLIVMIEQMRQSQSEAALFYERLGVPHEQIVKATAPYTQGLAVASRELVAMVLLAGFVSAWLSYAFGRRVLHKVGIEMPGLPAMTMWRVPPVLVWVFMGAVVLATGTAVIPPAGLARSVMGMLPPDDVAAIVRPVAFLEPLDRLPSVRTAGETVALNLLALTGTLFSLQGGIVGWMLMAHYNVPRVWRWVLLVLVVTNSGPIVFLLGVADAAFDLRRRWMPAVAA